jgi:hypothetical protein
VVSFLLAQEEQIPAFLKRRVVASGREFEAGSFEAKMEMRATGKICQLGSRKVSYWEIVAMARGDQRVTFPQTSLKTLNIPRKDT